MAEIGKRERLTKLVDGAWNGQPCFVVGGGPSLKTLDWKLLEDLPNVIVINRAYRDCQTADIFFTEDIRFIEKFSQASDWATFQGLKVFHSLDPMYLDMARKADPSLIIIEKKRPDKFWSKSFADGLSYSSNSMIGALNIADILGASTIFILGLDCKRTENLTTNYHSDYPIDWRVNGAQLESFASDFKHWAAMHLKSKLVVNLNLDSGVDCWVKVDRDRFLARRNMVLPLFRD